MTVPLPPRILLTADRESAWIYDEDGEPAFEITFTRGKETTCEVTPMHMDGRKAETVRIVAS